MECSGSDFSSSPKIGGGLPFRLALSGYAGHLRVEPLPPVMRETPLSSLPDLILPTPLPKQTPETIQKRIEQEYLVPGLDHEEDSADRCGRMWDFDWLGAGASHLEPTLPRAAVVPVWEPPFRRGRKHDPNNMAAGDNAGTLGTNAMDAKDTINWIPEFEEVEVIYHREGAHNSSSVLRKPGPPEDFVRGSTGNHPFRPGGFNVSQALDKRRESEETLKYGLLALLDGGPLHTVPPGFTRGLDLGVPEPLLDRRRKMEADNFVQGLHQKNEDSKVHFSDIFRRAWEQEQTEQESEEAREPNSTIIEAKESKPEEIEAEVTVLENVVADFEERNIKYSMNHGEKKDEIWAIKGGSEDVVDHFSKYVPDMALSFPFELDSFQKEAIYHLERSESVFVAAHTSAGKTVVAEYAFALATKHCTRAVYTSPIKTISNQKYRDFSDRFNVGIITGDVSLKPEASCLIMTTEILRSMLYKGADIIRDIEWVIFDEVHYVNDVERGVVWEEVIIMLPDHVNMVLLSATVPNTFEFADWIGRTKQKKIYVTGTSKRPVPLEHCLYYSGELYRICDHEIFLPQGVKEARDAFNSKNLPKVGTAPGKGGISTAGRGGSAGRGWTGGRANQGQKGSGQVGAAPLAQRGGSGGWKSETSQWYSLINNLSKKGLLPVVVFCFSKNRCDQSADNLKAMDLTSASEKSEIRVFCDKGFSRLKGSDRRLSQVVRIEDLLRRGIGVHHAGLLPVVKEVVEMLFCRGVIKVLFSTETFAMGVNAPARTVTFHGLRKHDGKSFRQLLPGEYTQMAGRAGRRGLDKIGTVVIMCWEDIPEEGDLRRLLTGKPTKLESQFRLTYSMILNLLRVEDLKVEDMLKRSFAEFHAQRALPQQQQQLQEGEGELSQMKSIINCILGEPTIEDYYEFALEAERLGDAIQETVMQSKAAQQLLTPGRVVVICTHLTSVPSLGVILRAPTSTMKNWIVLAIHRGKDQFQWRTNPKSTSNDPINESSTDEGYFISRKSSRGFEDEYSVLGRDSRKGSGMIKVKFPYFGRTGGTGYVAMEVNTKGFLTICKSRIQVDTVQLLEDISTAAYSRVVQQLLQLERDYPHQDPPAIDPIKDLKLNDIDVVEKYRARQVLLDKMAQNQCHRCPKLWDHYSLIRNQYTLKEKVKQLKFELSDAALQQMPDFQQRIEVLQELGYADADLVVQLKGRVACEINSGDELIATECLFDNQLVDLDPAEAVALLSALVFQQKETTKPSLTAHLEVAKERMIKTAIQLGEKQANHGLPIDPEDYARDSLKFGLVEVVYEWAKGTPFADICELTDVPEGSIVRTIVRLDETCREFKNAARIIGDSALYKKMSDASEAIKRDIVFATSLYVTGMP